MVSTKNNIEENFLKLSIGDENIKNDKNTFESHLYGFQIQELYKIALNFYKGKQNFYSEISSLTANTSNCIAI